tara:strand:- start:1048 stop:1203 length:156 start_codon:yes stop_codon:yes gene_type:complete
MVTNSKRDTVKRIEKKMIRKLRNIKRTPKVFGYTIMYHVERVLSRTEYVRF